MIPVSVVTGFLGSGKTTLISRVLRDPSFGRAAVIVNEFGEVGLDHDLIASSDDSVLTMSTGCLCCTIQTDLARTLMELLERRDAGLVGYDRVLIETSGLSDPSPMLQSMLVDKRVSAIHRIPFVVTLIDTVRGEEVLRDHAEARHQLALADRVLISKTDIRDVSDPLMRQLDTLNPGAPRSTTDRIAASDLFGDAPIEALTERLSQIRWRGSHSGIETFSVVRDRPMPALALTMLLQALTEHCGSRLLRVKGLVAIDEMPGRPMVVHAVGHAISVPEFLDCWPGREPKTRIVFITMGVPPHFVSRLLDAIEEEVRDASDR